jgi:hypothetical protein
MTGYSVSAWITFLRKYGPIPSNDNMYDEHIQSSVRRNGVTPLRFETGNLFSEVHANLAGADPVSVVLTGTAGDGKTFLCRELWLALGGASRDWESDEKFRSLALPSGRRLHVIKDLSELSAEEAHRLAPMAEAVLSPESEGVFLVAANDGQLLQAWDRIPTSPAVTQVRAIIEGLLVKSQLRAAEARLKLYNLSRQSSSELMRHLLDALLAHEGWKRCDGCRGQQPGPENRCPIWENYQRMQDALLRERLTDLLELCDRSGFHLPVRQLLILASNMLLGHPEAKDAMMRCHDVPKLVQKGRTAAGALYRNAFGENLPPGRRASTEVFEIVGRFGVGEETSNRIDNLLTYGSDDSRLQPLFDELVRSDPVYGAHREYVEAQSRYLEGSNIERAPDFREALAAQRQRLFFTVPPARVDELALWELTVFQFAGEYLAKVLRPVLRGDARVEKRIVGRLVRGLNRVFTGLLTTEERQLFLASSGSYSQARVSRIAEHQISVELNRGERVAIERDDSGPALAVYLDRAEREALPLHLVRYEFLSRVAEGALPTNFSRECYEDVLSFKSRLLRRWRRLKERDREAEAAQEIELKLLEPGRDGRLNTKAITVRLERGDHGS